MHGRPSAQGPGHYGLRRSTDCGLTSANASYSVRYGYRRRSASRISEWRERSKKAFEAPRESGILDQKAIWGEIEKDKGVNAGLLKSQSSLASYGGMRRYVFIGFQRQ